MTAVIDYCELCGLAIAADEYCDGCREAPEDYEPRHATCCEAAEES